MRRLMILLGLVALGFVWATPAVKGQDSEERVGSFTFTKFNAPFPGAVNTEGNGINNLSQVVGDYANGTDSIAHGYLREPDGSFAMIDVPFPSTFQFPIDLNNLGVIVGRYHTDSVPGPRGNHCYVLNAGVFTTIDVPFLSTFDTRCRGINDPGQIVGSYRDDSTRHRHGFLLSGGSFSTIDFPGATDTFARRINNLGQIVGWYFDANGLSHGFLLIGGTFFTADVPGAIETQALDINNNGQIVGAYVDTDDHVRSFLFAGGNLAIGGAGGILTTVALPGVTQNANGSTLFNLNFNVGIFGINDGGVITGVFLGADGNFHGFIGVPED